MSLEKSFIPYGAYWSSPFCRWQGSLSQVNAIELMAMSTKKFFADRGVAPETFDRVVLGWTVPQRRSFYGGPWLAAMIGAEGITGPNISQACATSARMLSVAAGEVELGLRECVLNLACDRTSNGPHVYYPNPGGIGGMGEAEEWVWDNFQKDPHGGTAMVQTAENVAKAEGITREEQDQVALLRSEQYKDALKDDRAYQKRYMLPIEIPKGRKKVLTIETDEGVFPTTAEGLAKLRPPMEGGTVTFGTQTYPADGNAGLVVCTEERAKSLSKDPNVTIRIAGFGDARVEKSHMPKAVVPAALEALRMGGIGIDDCKVVKTHNPFAVNDIYFSRQTGLAPEKFNQYGSPIIWGHPQGPTGLRVVIEVIEELVMAGGGYGLFSGCAAGDTAMSVLLEVR
jgi:acetyl-CoA acetyltransferase family protein